jgi:hypothetical protein
VPRVSFFSAVKVGIRANCANLERSKRPQFLQEHLLSSVALIHRSRRASSNIGFRLLDAQADELLYLPSNVLGIAERALYVLGVNGVTNVIGVWPKIVSFDTSGRSLVISPAVP